MDPVAQVFAQQQSGSAGGEGFGQFAVAGMQAGLARRRLALEERQDQRQADRQSMLLPLEAGLMKEQAANLGATASYNKAKLDAQTQQNFAMPELVDLQVRFMQAPDGFSNRALIDEARALSKRYPAAFVPGAPGNDLLTQVLAVPMLESKWRRALGRAKEVPAGMSISLPEGGQVSRSAERTPMLPEADRLRMAREMGLEPSGLDEQGRANFSRPTQRTERRTIMRPDGSVEMVEGPASEGGLTTTMQTDLQRKLASADTAIMALDRGMEAVQAFPEGVGAGGKVRSAIEIGRGMLNPRAEVDMPATKVQQELAKTFQQISDGLRIDTGNMSKYELEQLERLGKEDTWLTSPQKVQQTYEGLRSLSVAAKVRAQKSLTGSVDNRTLAQLPANEINRMFSSGFLDVSEASRALQTQVQTGKLTLAEAQSIMLRMQDEARKLGAQSALNQP